MLLRERRPDDRPRAFPGKLIAEQLGLYRGQSAVCDSISAFRRKIVQLLAGEDIKAAEDTVIVTARAGYQLNQTLKVEDLTGRAPDATPQPDTRSSEDRQAWFLAELAQGRKLRRRDLEERFGISTATAKRDLAAMHGKIEFLGSPAAGTYDLTGPRGAQGLQPAGDGGSGFPEEDH
jgi:hypothetical protein